MQQLTVHLNSEWEVFAASRLTGFSKSDACGHHNHHQTVQDARHQGHPPVPLFKSSACHDTLFTRGCRPPIMREVPSGSNTITTSALSFSPS